MFYSTVPTVTAAPVLMSTPRGERVWFSPTYVEGVLAHHGVTDTTLVVWVCTGCGSIGEAPDTTTKVQVPQHFDVTCHEGRTFLV